MTVMAYVRRCALVVALASAGLAAGCSRSVDDRTSAELMRLYRARDYFTLRERLATLPTAPVTLVARAAVQHAFNRPDSSNATIGTLLARHDVPDSLRLEARRLELSNDMRLYRYGAARDVAAAILAAPWAPADSAEHADLENARRLGAALADVPPQALTGRVATTVVLEGGHLPVTVNGHRRSYLLDTGANLSVLMRSEADSLGLGIRPAGVEVGTATDVKVTADLAVADSVRLGGLAYANVVFLVLPDKALTLPGGTRIPGGGFRIPGILGFPLIEPMGELRIRGDTVSVPASVPKRPVHNLALEQFSMLTPVRWRGSVFICQFDTGANTTSFYEPFYRRYTDAVEAAGIADTARVGGAGGIRRIPVFRLPTATLSLADTTVTLRNVDVYRTVIRDSADNYAYCNIGQDVLRQFRALIINLRSMSLLLD
ncbi:MAG: retropepsin-like aspartic protease [Gemmatimonadota bacterium]|jgi:predicted aspartyl protease